MEISAKVSRIMKKFTCTIIIFLMLISIFIVPIQAIAKESGNVTSAKDETSITSKLDEFKNSKVEASTSENKSTASENKSSTSEETEKTADENESSTSKADEFSNSEEELGASEDEAITSEETEETASENEESESKATNEASTNAAKEENSENAAKENSEIKKKGIASTKLSNKAKSEETNLLTKDGITIKTKNDNHEINTFQMQFVSGATKDNNNNLVWTPENSSEGHEFTFRVNYAISGLKELLPEAIQMKIPKSILRNKDGYFDDKIIMSLPSKEEYNGKTELAYIEDEDYLIVYNPREVASGMNGYFEIAYATKSKTFNYKDYDVKNTDLIKNGGTASDPFSAVITVKSGDDTLANITNEEKVYINTTAKIISTQKRYPTLYKTWNNSWTETAPADKDDYYYLVWEICTNISSPTQRYNFELKDFVTNLTEGTPEEDYKLVGYKLSGEQYYSDKNIREDISSEGIRYDYVLTRHKKATFENIKYKLKNTVTATVDPAQQIDEDTMATSSNTFEWNPVFTPPVGHFNSYKYGNYKNYELDKLQNNDVDKLEGFKYSVETVGYAYPWTIEEGTSSDDPKNYGKKPVKYITWDDTLYLDDETNHLSSDDYYLDYLTFEINNKDVEYDDFYKEFKEKALNYEKDEIITFFAKFENETDWVEVGSINLKTKEITKVDKYVSEMSNGKIVFNEHCIGWKFETANTHYYTNIRVYPYYVITNSDYIAEKIKGRDSISLKNIAHTIITNYKDGTIFENEILGIDYARVTYYESQITKRVASASNNVAEREYTVTWVVNAWERITSGKGESEYNIQDSGIFYDLIPHGGVVDVNSIQIRTEKGFLEENEYTYNLISNYNNTGRTMLVVNIKEQAKYYTVYYSTVHSWENIKDFGRNVLNPVAYETGNEKIAKGYPDDGGNLSTENKAIFVDLDKTTDDVKFIYAEETYNINALTAAMSGLYKKVKNSKETEYVYDTVVEPNGKYTYQLRFQNTHINKAKDLIFFDSLENFEVVNSEKGEIKTSAWRGTLEKIDLTQLKQKGIDAKIYISTIPNLKLEENNDLNDIDVWTQVDENADLSNAKAFAIDMRNDTAGNEFILNSGDSITAIAHMRAPEEGYEDMEKNPYTYNNIYIHDILIDELEGTEEYFIHQDYTTVKYHVVADVPFRKVNAKNEEEGIKGITFRLYGTSKYGLDVDIYKTSDKDGYINFREIEAGEYILQEYEGNIDWVEDHTEHKVRITHLKEVYIDEQKVEDKNTVKVQNTPRAHTDVQFTKKDLLNKTKTIAGVKFKLYGTSRYGNEILMYGISDENGIVKFENLEYGTYELEEIDLPEIVETEDGLKQGYIIGDEKYRVIVDENSNYDVLMQNEETNEYKSVYSLGDHIIYNEPLHIVEFYKRDAYDKDISIPGAKFKLFGTSRYGNSYNEEVTSKNNGLVQFSGLEAGEYLLQETFVPKIEDSNGNEISYVKDDRKYIVTVEKNGQVTIDGIGQNKYGTYIFYNERNKGQITITKKWLGDSEASRTEPTINISTEAPLESKAPIFRNNYNSSSGPLGYVRKEFGNKAITSFARTKEDLTEEQVQEKGAVRIDNKYDDDTAKYKIYSWIEEDGSCFWWSNSEVAILTDSSKYLFKLSSATKIDTTGINTSKVTNMSYMFYYCRSLTDLDLSNFDTSNVTDMSYMFYYSSNLTSLDLSKFDTSSVTDMSYMFRDCSNLTSIDLSKFDTSRVTNMSEMFRNCSNLTSLDLSSFDTSEVTNMSKMFYYSINLTSLNVSNFNTSKVTNMSYMLYNCFNLTSLDVSKFVTSNVTDMYQMFLNCSNLTSLDLSSFDTSEVTNMSSMFSGCRSLTSLNISSFNTSSVTNMSYMFSSCSSLTSLDVSKFVTSSVTDMRSMFSSCSSLTSLDVSKFVTSSVTNMSFMFDNCSSLTSLNVSNFNTGNVTDMKYMFDNCSNLTSLDVSNFNTSRVTDMKYMFDNCSNLTSLDVSRFDTSKVTDMRVMFNGCSKLTSLNLSSFNTSNVTNMSSMFRGCSKLTSLDLSNFNTGNVTDMRFMFRNCSKLTSLDVSNFNTSRVTDMKYMFDNCSNLTSLDVSSFDTSKVTDMSSMFAQCSNLTTIEVSEHFIVEKRSAYMFSDCSKLVGGNGTKYTSSKTDESYACIDNDEHPGYFTYKASTIDSSTPDTQNLANNSVQSFISDTFMLSNAYLEEDEIQSSLDEENISIGLIDTTLEEAGLEEKASEEATSEEATSEETKPTKVEYTTKGNEANWVKDGDTWTYTFYVDDPYATWYVWEEQLSGYESSYTKFYPGTVENQKATIINNKVTSTPKEDKEPSVGFGSLEITKTLKKKTDSGEETITNDNTEFTFKVTLTAKAGQGDYISGTKIFGNYIFKDGVANIKLKAGETATISDLLAGTTYEITESEIEGYEISENKNGVIAVGNTNVEIVNYKKKSETPEENPGESSENNTVSFHIAKKVVGNYDVESSYKLEIVLDNLKPNTEYSLSNGTKFTSNSVGSASVQITLNNGDSVTVKDIPVGSKYKVYEYAGDYISSYVITDSNNKGLINNSSNSNKKSNVALSTNTETADEGENITITFTNERKVTQNLKIAKEVTNEEDKNSYTFTIELGNMKERTSFNTSFGKITANSAGSAEVTIYLTGGEVAEMYDVPVGTTYKVTEQASSAIATYTITDINGINKIVKASGANDKAKKPLSTELETVNEGEEAIVTFVNDITNQEKDSVVTNLGVTKKVIGMNGELQENYDGTFTFELTAEDENNPMPEKNEVQIVGNGTASFGEITFEKTGTYTYKVVEKAIDSDELIYDDSIYTIIYEVTDPEGLLEITKTVKKNGFNGDIVEFINKLVKVDVKVKKVDEGKEALEGAVLQISDSESNVVTQWTSTKEAFIAKLSAGTYKLHEVTAPAGHKVAEDIDFVINKEGQIIVNDEIVDLVTMQDDYIKVQIKKIDLATGKDIIGATLQVLDENGEVAEAYNSEGTEKVKLEWVTEEKLDENGNVVLDEEGNVVAKEVIFTKLPVGNYTLKEKQAPIESGYVYAEDIKFEVLETEEIQKVEMKDDYTKVKVNKVDENGKFVEGATLAVKDLSGNVVVQWVTTNESYEINKKLVPGRKYILEEIQVPKDYNKAENIEFTVSEDGREDIITMIDKTIEVKPETEEKTPEKEETTSGTEEKMPETVDTMPKTGQTRIIYIIMIIMLIVRRFMIIIIKRKKDSEDEE